MASKVSGRTDQKLARGRPPDQRKALRNLALVVREGVPAEVIRDCQLMLLKGFEFELYEDEDGQLQVRAKENAMSPTIDHKLTALKFLAERGYGLPVQTVHLEAELRAQVASMATEIPLGQLPPGALRAIREALASAREPVYLDAASEEPAPQYVDAASVEGALASTQAASDDNEG